ncbi:hypothetical protein ACJVC5_05600 [Peredibacter sp. HCB2-198]|uniref:hypothetical protein n=1 Tax=Peredibacter sp. HCB2-198 TaxID=3383025 RepID=UPI0038B4B6D4
MNQQRGFQMDVKNHFFLTFVALFFLGVIVAKPGETFQPAKEERDCRLVKGKMACVYHYHEDRITNTIGEVRYQYK